MPCNLCNAKLSLRHFLCKLLTDHLWAYPSENLRVCMDCDRRESFTGKAWVKA